MKADYAKQLHKELSGAYDAIAEDFSRTRSAWWEELKFVSAYVHAEDMVLDIGCGNGRLFEELRDKKITYTGIDSSKKLIELARERHLSSTTFLQGDALRLPFGNESFHVVFSFAVLHHIPSEKLRLQFMSEAYRVLTKDGVAVLSVWNLWHKKYLGIIAGYAIKKLLGRSPLDMKDIFLKFGDKERARFLHAFTRHEFEKLARRAGFTVEKSILVKRKSGQSNFLLVCRKS
ncbi:MAG: class I SAM-dependent methyltransferase [Patescibacteria group bacterium]|nr:class I SAM-dependent methyltransferase [Patescibacteria group bacterium]